MDLFEFVERMNEDDIVNYMKPGLRERVPGKREHQMSG